MTNEEKAEEKLIGCSDDRFEIIARARKHIIEATNIEMSPKEMEVLDNFLFRCWQMGWLKNDYKELEKENEQLKCDLYNTSANLERITVECENLQKENKELNNQLYDLKESYNKIIDEVIETAKSYGLISETCLWQYINEYDNKEITYNELYEKLLSVAVNELEFAIVDMKKRL